MGSKNRTKDSRPPQPAQPRSISPLLPIEGQTFGRSLANWMFPLYVLLITLGFFALRSDGAMARGNELTKDRALFASVNAATMTGFQQTIGLEQYEIPAKYTVLALMIGGMLFSLIIASLAVIRILRLPYSDWQVINAACIWTVLVLLIGSPLLMKADRSFFDCALLAASAFGNCGLVSGTPPSLLDAQTHIILLPITVLGAIGLPVLMELVDRVRGRIDRLSDHSRVVIAMSAGAYVLFLLVFLFFQWIAAGTDGFHFRTALASSSGAAINSRTAGFPFQFAYAFPRAMQWSLIAAMLIGGAPASSAGGLKVTTVSEIFRGVLRILRAQPIGRSLAIALSWTGSYVLIILICFLTLLCTDPQVPSDRMFFETVSAVGNVGLSYDPISIVGPGLYTLTAAMFVGRMLPLLILWWQADTTTDADLAVA